MKIGFTEDGFVFIASECKSPEGEPMEMYATYTPNEALDFSRHLKDAAKKARKQIIGVGSNGKEVYPNDRTRTH